MIRTIRFPVWILLGLSVVLGLAILAALLLRMSGDSREKIPADSPAGDFTTAEMDVTPRPDLRARLRETHLWVGEPAIISVRLRNRGAMTAARNLDRLAQYTVLGTDPAAEARRSGLPLPSENETRIRPLMLNGDWRAHIRISVARLSDIGSRELVEADAVPFGANSLEVQRTVGAVPLAATWILEPVTTLRMGPGRYQLSVKLTAEHLLSGEFKDLKTKLDMTLTEPSGPADQARIEQNAAFYLLSRSKYEAALERALKAISFNPSQYPAYWYAAECYRVMNRPEKAADIIRTLLDRMPPELYGGDFHTVAQRRLEQLTEAR